jgi:competence protein ComEA
MPAENDLHEKLDWRQLLRRVDQVAVALLVLSALAAMAVYWFASGGHRGQLIEIDRAPPLQAVFLVNINEAAPAELTQLPGIGKELARRIVVSREREGRFLEERDLLRVNGMGARTLERIHPFLLPMSTFTDGQREFSATAGPSQLLNVD